MPRTACCLVNGKGFWSTAPALLTAALVGSAVNITRLYPHITRGGLWRERNGRLIPDKTDAMKILENGRSLFEVLGDCPMVDENGRLRWHNNVEEERPLPSGAAYPIC
jgi:hypothetical protein